MAEAPKASVFVLTHDHVDWIERALDSALEQRAPFEFELLVADDCSTDGTREKVLEYAARHPDRIRTFLPDRNLGVAGIWLQAARQCRGEYVAILEGDDFWTSPDKLARQVGLLDNHPGWSSCFHRATLFFDDGSRPSRPATPAFAKDVFGLDDILRSCFIPFLTVAFRREVLATVPEWLFEYRWFDWLFHIWCAQRGAIGFFDEDLACYRVHAGGNWSARGRLAQLEEDLRVYERLATEIPGRRELIARCAENRQCQIAVELAGVSAATPVALVEADDSSEEQLLYFNGREAAALRAGDADAGAALGALVGRAKDAPHELHYPVPEVEPRRASDAGCALVAPRSVELQPGRPLADLLQGEPIWADEWCRVWEVAIDSSRPGQEGEDARGDMGALVEIAEVALAEPLPAELHGRHIDEPKSGAVLDAKSVDIIGWALGAERSAVAVEFSYRGEPFWRASLRAERPDLVEAFPDTEEAARAGFRTTLNLLGTGAEFEVEAAALL